MSEIDRAELTDHIADLEAELSSIDVWWTSQPREKQDKWFHATTSMLNKRHQELAANPYKNGSAPINPMIPI